MCNIQMVYSTLNLVGTRSYESRDSGLSDFGYELVAEMSRGDAMCDLSYMRQETSEDVFQVSKRPAA